MHLIKLTAILTAASAIVLCSCHKDHDKYVFVDTSVARSFVQQYDSIDELEFRQLETRQISVNIKHSKMGGLWNTHIYDSLCKKHNDLNFNGKIYNRKNEKCTFVNPNVHFFFKLPPFQWR